MGKRVGGVCGVFEYYVLNWIELFLFVLGVVLEFVFWDVFFG